MTEAVYPRVRLQAEAMRAAHMLREYRIPVQQWGEGQAKTVLHLAQEILKGETELVIENGKLLRRISIAHVDVRYRRPDGVELRIVEDRQVFADGRVRERGRKRVSEKMKSGEDLLETAKRGLLEELGVKAELEFEDLGSKQEVQISSSYPGLTTEYNVHKMRTFLPDEAFNPEGYKEVQKDKTTYFVWREVLEKATI